MTEIIENKIEKRLESYCECNKRYEELIEIMDDHYVRTRLGYAYDRWDERRREDILCQFQSIIDRRDELRKYIHQYFIDKIEETSEVNSRTALSMEYNKFKRMSLQKPPAWSSTLETSLSHKKSVDSKKRSRSKFSKILKTMRIHFNCYS